MTYKGETQNQERKEKVTTLQVLKAMRRLLVKGWTQNFDACDRDGLSVDSGNARAVCWCVLGAYDRVLSKREENPEVLDLLFKASCKNRLRKPDDHPAYTDIGKKKVSILVWNDARRRTKEQVLSMMDKAIDFARA